MIDISDVKINYDDVLARLGFLKAKTKISHKAQENIKHVLALSKKLIIPKLAMSNAKIKSIDGNIVSTDNGYEIKSFDIAKLLNGSCEIYGIAATIGQEIERARNKCIDEKNVFDGIVFDAAGSVAVENLIGMANDWIKNIAKKNNKSITRRFSCGYGDWALSNQKEFLEWVGGAKIGIKLNESFLMAPEKSVSALIGVKDE